MLTVNTSMQGKTCMVTGANSGIGKATALGLAQMGANVVMVARDRARGEVAQNEVKAKSGNNSVDLLVADLSSQESIRKFVEDFKQHHKQLHVLINNAGVFMLTRRETVDGLEITFAVNYLAPFLLTNLLLDVLKASAPARIVNVSSEAHENGYIKMDDLQAKKNYRPFRAYEEGAKTSIYLATSTDVEDVTGKYFVKSVISRSAPISYDESLQRQLWEESAKLVKLPVDELLQP